MKQDLGSLAIEGATLKRKVADMKKRLQEINNEMSLAAEFKEGSKTGHLEAGGYEVKVSLRDNVRWDQGRLIVVNDAFKCFGDAFKTEFKPDSAKKLELAMAKDSEFAKAVNWARSVKPGAPSVTYESITAPAEGEE